MLSLWEQYIISCFQRLPGCLTTSPSQLTDFLVSLMHGFNKSYLCLISSCQTVSGVPFCNLKISAKEVKLQTPFLLSEVLPFICLLALKQNYNPWSQHSAKNQSDQLQQGNKYQVTSYLNNNSIWSIMAFGCLENLSSQLEKQVSKAKPNQFSKTLELSRIAHTHFSCIQPISQVQGWRNIASVQTQTGQRQQGRLVPMLSENGRWR